MAKLVIGKKMTPLERVMCDLRNNRHPEPEHIQQVLESAGVSAELIHYLLNGKTGREKISAFTRIGEHMRYYIEFHILLDKGVPKEIAKKRLAERFEVSVSKVEKTLKLPDP